MNKLLQTIKENDERFKRLYCLQSVMDIESQENIKFYIVQSRIRELEVLVEMIKKMQKETYRPDMANGSRQIRLDENIGYNYALMHIIQSLKDTIKELKNK